MTKAKRRPRKSTFVVRKEEKQRLEQELTRLQAQWRALHATTTAAAADTGPTQPQAHFQSQSGSQLHGLPSTALRDRHVAFNGLRSLLAAYFMSHHATAAYDAIHLPSDPTARRSVLLRHSAPKIRDMRLMVLERCRFLDLARPSVASEWFESDDGDMFLLQFDVTPFRGLRCSVRDVHDAVGFYVQNVEIYVSERIGDLTIREDDEVDASTDARVSQRRVVSTTSACGIMIDANVAVFRQHFPHGTSPDLEDEHSIMVTHSVESDELYPYVPGERVRHDLSSGMIIKQVATASGERVTTLVRSVVVKRHHRSGVVADPTEDVQSPMRALATQWEQLMLEAVKERLIAPMVAPTMAAEGSASAGSSPASSVGSF